MTPDAPRSILSMFMKIDFSMIFPGLAWRRVIRTPPLLLGGVPQVYENGAKHSPPGSQGAPDCPGPHPPVWFPETPLLPHNFPGTSPIQESKICIPMIFNALSDGQSPASRFVPQPLRTRHVFAKIIKNHEKSMFIKSIQGASGSIQESLKMVWSDP